VQFKSYFILLFVVKLNISRYTAFASSFSSTVRLPSSF